MTQIFDIPTPENLREIAQFIEEGSVNTTATVWSATRRRNGGKSNWDGRIIVSFYTNGKNRHADVARLPADDEPVVFAQLKYTPALNWCYAHLKKWEAF